MSETYGTTRTENEARPTTEQAKDGAQHLAEVGKDEAKNLGRETGQQAKEVWQQTRSELMSQSATQQSRVAEGLRSLSQELGAMASGSDQQGVGSDLAHQASQRLGDVAGWLDQRDPGSLVAEAKQFARQRPGTFLAAAAAIGLIGGRLSRGLVADHQDDSPSAGGTPTPNQGEVPVTDHSTAGYSAYGSPAGATTPEAENAVSGNAVPGNAVPGGTSASGPTPSGLYGSAAGAGTDESFR